jgi:DnaK suppressor protein
MRQDIDFDQFRKLLEAENMNIKKRIDMDTKELQSYSDPNPDLLDEATKLFNQEQRIEWITFLRERQILIDEAFQRIENGQYGICANCGKDIEVERLEIKPYAKYCVRCREKEEQKSW